MISEQPKQLLDRPGGPRVVGAPDIHGHRPPLRAGELEGLGEVLPRSGDRGSRPRQEDHQLPHRQRCRVHLPQVGGAPTTYGSARDAVLTALDSEERVTAQFEALANAARDAKDNRTLQFVQWFIEEQVEEERTMTALIDVIDSGINLFQAEALLDGIGH